ncbi:MAG: hypothetical protein ACHBN1_36785 [Heteroscytonema crispum UTEX LB 1556]
MVHGSRVHGSPALKGEAVRWAASPTVRNCRGFHATKAHSPDPSLAAVAMADTLHTHQTRTVQMSGPGATGFPVGFMNFSY